MQEHGHLSLCLLEDLPSSAAYREVFLKRDYVLFQRTEISQTDCSVHICVYLFFCATPSCPVSLHFASRSKSVLHCSARPFQRWLRNYLIDVDAIPLHIGPVIHLSPFHKLHEKDTPCGEIPVDPGDLKQKQMG